MVKIYINARFLTQPITGVQRYAIELVRALDRLIDCGAIDKTKYSFLLLAPRNTQNEPGLTHIPFRPAGRLKGHLWEQLELPFFAKDGLLVNLCNTGPLQHHFSVVVIHDAAVFAYPQAFSAIFRTWYRMLLPRLGKAARKVITVSLFSKKELTTYFGIPEHKITVIYPGKEQMYNVSPDCSILHKYNLVGRNYVLSVSSIDPRKNFGAVVKAMELLAGNDYEFVVAGGANPKVFNAPGAPLPDTVHHMGYVSDGELRALYEHAACFVFPSFYEGFGLPPLEAMACGCPVIVSPAASLPEICGDAALYCNPGSPADIAAKIRLLMADQELRVILRRKGLDNAKRFSYNDSAREIFKVIEEALALL